MNIFALKECQYGLLAVFESLSLSQLLGSVGRHLTSVFVRLPALTFSLWMLCPLPAPSFTCSLVFLLCKLSFVGSSVIFHVFITA